MVQGSGYRPDIDVGWCAIAVAFGCPVSRRTASQAAASSASTFFRLFLGYLITSILLRGDAGRQLFAGALLRTAGPADIGAGRGCWRRRRRAGGADPDQLAASWPQHAGDHAFVSNFYLGMTANYFSTRCRRRSLCCTWSLAVEEFYIVFPVMLALLMRWFPCRLEAWSSG